MDTNNNFDFLVSFFLPEGILDWFEYVKVIEEPIKPKKDELFKSRLHIYLDERDNRTNEHLFLKP